MNRTLSNLFIFAVGAAIGSAVTLKFLEKKYKQIADEEIASVKEVFSSHLVEPDETKLHDYRDLDQYIELAKSYSKEGESDMRKKEENVEPFVIDPKKLDEYADFYNVPLTLYADGVLLDEYDEKVDDDFINDNIGSDFKDHFGEYERDTVYVVNPNKQEIYEIVLDVNKSTDIIGDDESDDD